MPCVLVQVKEYIEDPMIYKGNVRALSGNTILKVNAYLGVLWACVSVYLGVYLLCM